MITSALLHLLFIFLGTIISMFPEYSGMPVAFDSAISTITPYLNYLNNFIPVDTFWEVLNIAFVFYSALLSFKLLNWVVNKVRGSG
jgi:hypothetical protein